jgi:hypothetical protein
MEAGTAIGFAVVARLFNSTLSMRRASHRTMGEWAGWARALGGYSTMVFQPGMWNLAGSQIKDYATFSSTTAGVLRVYACM